MLEALLDWDKQSLIYLNNLGSNDYDAFWLAITSFVNWTPLFLLLIFLLFYKNRSKEGLWMLLSFISMLVLLSVFIFITKESTVRLRPNNDPSLNYLLRTIHNPAGYSFFSGHASSSFSIAGLAILFLRKRFRWIYVVWIFPILFSYSRMYLGVHYPIDIIVGTCVGLFFGWIFYRMHRKIIAPYIM